MLGLLEAWFAHQQCGCQPTSGDGAREGGYGKVRLCKAFVVAMLGSDR